VLAWRVEPCEQLVAACIPCKTDKKADRRIPAIPALLTRIKAQARAPLDDAAVVRHARQVRSRLRNRRRGASRGASRQDGREPDLSWGCGSLSVSHADTINSTAKFSIAQTAIGAPGNPRLPVLKNGFPPQATLDDDGQRLSVAG
jgi:hypothetical protein